MASHALSKRRQPLRRPKLCHDSGLFGHPPPPPDPPATPTCLLELQDLPPYETDDEIMLDMIACNTDFPDDLVLVPTWEVNAGEIIGQEDVINCQTTYEAIYESPPLSQEITITMTVKWPNETVCVSSVTFMLER